LKKYIAFVVLMMSTACVVFIAGVRFPTVVALCVLVGAVAMDFLTTYLCLRKSGREGNPVIAFLFRKLTIGGTFALMLVIWGLFIWFRWLPSNVGNQTAIALTYWLIPINNAIVLRRLCRKTTKVTV